MARVALAVLKTVGELASVDATRCLDLIQRQIETLLPLRAVLRVRPGQGTADTQHDGLGRLRERAARHRRARHDGSKRPFDQGATADVTHVRLHPWEIPAHLRAIFVPAGMPNGNAITCRPPWSAHPAKASIGSPS